MHPGPTTMVRVLRHYVTGGIALLTDTIWRAFSAALRFYRVRAWMDRSLFFLLPGDRATLAKLPNSRDPAITRGNYAVARIFFPRTIVWTIRLSWSKNDSNIYYGTLFALSLASGNVRELHASLAAKARHPLYLSFVKTALRYNLPPPHSLSRSLLTDRFYRAPWMNGPFFSRPYLSFAFTRSAAFLRPFVCGGGELLDIYCENRGVKINLCESRAQSRARRSVFRASRRAAKTRVEAVSLGHAVKYLCPVRQ